MQRIVRGQRGLAMQHRHPSDEIRRYVLGEPLRIRNRRALLLDDYFVEDRWNVKRRLKAPSKHAANPIVVPDRSWENTYVGVPSVIHDAEARLFRMWYASGDREAYEHQYVAGDWDPSRHGYPYYTCYAESRDGLHWDKPVLGRIEYRGHKDTNIVLTGEQKCQGIRVIPNHPSTGQPGKYLACYRDNLPGVKNSLCLAYSDDGITWRQDPANPVLRGVRDTGNMLLYDDERGEWLYYTRPKSWAAQHPITPGDKGNTKRRVAVSVGDRPQNLSYPRCVICPEEGEAPHIDTFPVVKCGTHFLGFRSVMDEELHTEVHLSFSRDGLSWSRLPGDAPYIPRGEEGSFDSGLTSPPPSVLSVGDDYYLYYGGRTTAQGGGGIGAIGLAVMPRDRFVMQAADHTGGYLLTREFLVEGDELLVNAELLDTQSSVEARLAAELVRIPHGGGMPEPVGGFSFDDCDAEAADALEHPITWQQKNLASVRGTAVQVRFYLRGVGLYSVQCAQ